MIAEYLDKKNPAWKYLIIFMAFSLVIYWPTLLGDPFWDDWVYIFKGFRLQLETANPISFFSGNKEAKSWPVFYSIIWAMLKIYKDHYFLYHLTNVIVHALNGVMLVTVLKKLKVSNAFWWTLLFLAHPAHLFTVSWIIQLKTSFSILFFLLSLNFCWNFFQQLKLSNYFSFLFFFLISILTKSTTAGFAAVICLSFPLVKNKISFRKFALLFVVPFFILGGYSVYRTSKDFHLSGQLSKEEKLNRKDIKFSETDFTEKPTADSLQPGEELYYFIGTADKILLSCKIFSRYVAFIFLPLNGDQLFLESTNLTFFSVEFLIVFLLVALLGMLIKNLYEKKYYLDISGLYFFIATLLPFCGLVFLPIFSYSNFIPYWLSIPLLGLIPIGSRYIMSKNTLVLLIVICAGWTHWQTYQFINTEELFLKSIKKSPEKFIYKVSLMEYYVNTYQCEKAKDIYDVFVKTYNPKMFNLETKVKYCEIFKRDKK